MGALSKGCVSCKRKKVKCDEIRPTCTRCRSAGIECTTSAPRLRFVDENPRIQRSVAVSQAQSREFATMTKSSHLAFHSNQLRRYQPGGSALFLANTLPLTAFKDDIFISYLFFKFFQGEHEYPFKNAGDTCVLPKEWIPELVKTSQQPHQKAWHALAAVTFGNAHNKSDVVKNSFKLYGQALSELRCKLSSPDAWRTDSTLASMTALYIYEVSHKSLYYRKVLMKVDTSVEGRQRVDVARKWSWVDFGVERSMAAKVLCWEEHFSRAPYYAGR
jgi:hypothetical protein